MYQLLDPQQIIYTNISQYVRFQFSFDRNRRWLFDDTAYFAIMSWNTASVAIVLQTVLQSDNIY